VGSGRGSGKTGDRKARIRRGYARKEWSKMKARFETGRHTSLHNSTSCFRLANLLPPCPLFIVAPPGSGNTPSIASMHSSVEGEPVNVNQAESGGSGETGGGWGRCPW
jgi:hypothetical protein